MFTGRLLLAIQKEISLGRRNIFRPTSHHESGMWSWVPLPKNLIFLYVLRLPRISFGAIMSSHISPVQFANFNVSYGIKVKSAQDLWAHSNGEQFGRHLTKTGRINGFVPSDVSSPPPHPQSLAMELPLNACCIFYDDTALLWKIQNLESNSSNNWCRCLLLFKKSVSFCGCRITFWSRFLCSGRKSTT